MPPLPNERGGFGWNRLAAAFFGLLLCAVVIFAAAVRYRQLEEWRKTPAEFFAHELPMMSTVDAYSWLKWARNYRDVRLAGTVVLPSPDDPGRDAFLPDSPSLLVVLIAWISHLTGLNIHAAGLYLSMLCSGLFAVPLGLYFRRLKFPAAGLLGAAIAVVSYEYLIRTSVGRVDTDALNLFFPLFASYGLLVSTGGSERRFLAGSALAGAFCFLFNWWYQRPLFTLAYFAVFLLNALLHRVPLKRFAAGAALFLLCAGPLSVWEGAPEIVAKITMYFNVAGVETSKSSPGVFLPNIFHTISETQHFSVADNLRLIVMSPSLSGVGLMLFAVFAFARPRQTLPLLPVVATGLFAFQSGRRFMMFLAPFCGVGYGALFHAAWNLIWDKKNSLFKKRDKPSGKNAHRSGNPAKDVLLREAPVHAAALLFLLAIIPKTAVSFVPDAKVPADVYSALLDLKGRVPPGSSAWNFWNYGYVIAEATGMHVYHDGSGTQFSPITYLISKGYLSPDPRELRELAAFIDERRGTTSPPGLMKMDDLPELLKLLDAAEYEPARGNIYFIYTRNMIPQLGSMSYIAKWDLKTGKSDPVVYTPLDCFGQEKDGTVRCREGVFNPRDGTMNGTPAFASLDVVRGGEVAQHKDYGRDGPGILFFIRQDGSVFLTLVAPKELYDSNFNQMYLLGRHDASLFEEVRNDFPSARVFRLKASGEP